MFGLKPKLKQALLIRQPHTYDDAVTFAKRKHHFEDTDSGTQLMDLLQEIRKEVSLKHTGIKQEPFQHLSRIPMPSIFNKKSPKLKRICEILKESMNTSHHQHAAPLHTNPTLSPFSNSYLRWKKTPDNYSRQNTLMPTPLLLETTEAFGPWTVWWFVNNVTV